MQQTIAKLLRTLPLAMVHPRPHNSFRSVRDRYVTVLHRAFGKVRGRAWRLDLFVSEFDMKKYRNISLKFPPSGIFFVHNQNLTLEARNASQHYFQIQAQFKSKQTLVVTVTRLLVGRSVVQIPAGKKYFFLPKNPYRLWGPPSLLMNGYRRSVTGVKRPRREADHSPPSRAEVKNEWS
jgi:hypothetical protein